MRISFINVYSNPLKINWSRINHITYSFNKLHEITYWEIGNKIKIEIYKINYTNLDN
jgi:hypothetical protein